jgi:uncharacterized protein (TIGR02145 family)
MNRFFTLLLAASCLTAVGQSGVCNYPILQVPQVVLLEGNGVWLSATSSDPLIWNLDVVADSIFVTSCGIYEVQELIDWGNGLITPCAFISVISVVSEECPETLIPSFCGEGTVWDIATSTCISANTADINNDGCVQLNDLLDLLTAYGDCGAEESAWQCGEPLEYQGYDYETVQIGEQCWFAENLRAENYSNGDSILANLNDDQWYSTTWGAVAVYGEGSSTCFTNTPDGDACDDAWSLNEYGRLYNWHAVNDSRGLCPVGWHVPSDEDWMTMEMALGMSEAEANETGLRGADQGTQMKTDYGWYAGGNGTNSSGFSGLPGGDRTDSGGFNNTGYYGYWWSSSPSGTDAWFRVLFVENENVGRFSSSPLLGFSVRCFRDAE